MKRLLAVILAAVMIVAMMAGCSGNGQTPEGTGGEGTPTEAQKPSENTESVSRIVMAFPTWSGAPKDLKMIQDALNEISVPEIGVEVELLVLDAGSYSQQMTLMMTGDEQLDIISTLTGNLFNVSTQNGQLMDLEEDDLIQTYGQGIIDALGTDYIDACRVGGVLYGLPNNRDMATGKGCYAIRTDLLEGIGYKFQGTEIEKATMDDINDIYAKLHEKYPDMEIYRPVAGSLMQLSDIDFLGGDSYGVLLDCGQTLDVVNLFESDAYMEYCQKVRNWYNAGYISPDAATDTTSVADLVRSGTLASYNTGGKPGIKVQESSLCGTDMTIIQTDVDFMPSNGVSGFPWAVPLNTVDPVATMKYLNLLYTNEEMMNLICWGIEGVHYVVKDDGFLTFPEGVDANSSGYNHSMNWMFPNQYLLKIWEGNPATLWDDTKTFNNESIHSKALGFTFDPANVLTEFTSVSNIYGKYQKSVEFGLTDPVEGIAAMNKEMKAAGLDLIIAEKTAQLEAWAAANGVTG